MTDENVHYVRWDVGAHTSFSLYIYNTIIKGVKNGMYAIQFFMGNPKQAWKRQQINLKDIENTQKLLSRFPMNVFSHYPYCANLAGKAQKGELAWDGNHSIDMRLKELLKSLEYELSIISNFSELRSGVVIHPGSYPDRDKGHEAVAKTINKINFPSKSNLLLENCAGEGNKLCRTFEEINIIMKLLTDDKRQHVKVCVDTAHIWGQGDYNLSEIEEVNRMFDDFDRILGIENFYLLHLNDSRAPLGSCKDQHALLGEGHIWGNDFGSLIHLLNKCKSYGIPIVLETDIQDMITLSGL